MRYQSLLNHFKKNDFSISTYLVEIKYLCDSLAGCGQLVSIEEQQSAILNGLPPKFDHVVSIITISQVPFDLQGIATALLDVEAKQQAHFSHVSFFANFVEADKTSSTSSNLLGYAGHPPPQLFRLTRGSGYFCGGGRGRSRLQC